MQEKYVVDPQRPTAVIQAIGNGSSNYAQFLDSCGFIIEVQFTHNVVHTS